MRRAYWIFAIAVSIASLLAGWFIAGARESAKTTAAATESPRAPAPTGTTGATIDQSPSGTTAGSSAQSEAPSTAAGAVAGLLAAVTADGDVVLIDPETAATVRTLVPRGSADPAISVAWDAQREVVYFGRGGSCASIWRYRLGYEPIERMAQGHHPVISPDGTRVAIATGCTDGGGVDGISVLDAATGTPTVTMPVALPAAATIPWYVGDVDWRPDGNALVVTVGWEGGDEQHVIDLRKPPRSVVAGSRVPIKTTLRETTFQQIEYVGQRLVIAAFCCTGAEGPASARIVVRDGKTGSLTSVATVAAYALTANASGRLRYLDADPSAAPAALWALDRLDAQPRRIGGSFRALSW